jgi:hypothetical protein
MFRLSKIVFSLLMLCSVYFHQKCMEGLTYIEYTLDPECVEDALCSVTLHQEEANLWREMEQSKHKFILIS